MAPSFHLFRWSEITVLHSGQVFSLLNHKVMHSSQNICCKGIKEPGFIVGNILTLHASHCRKTVHFTSETTKNIQEHKEQC